VTAQAARVRPRLLIVFVIIDPRRQEPPETPP
jgi:hypothetical protein